MKTLHTLAGTTAALALTAGLLGATSTASGATGENPDSFPDHNGAAHDPFGNHTMKWTREDVQKIMQHSNPGAAPKANSLSDQVSMPEIPADFPVMKDANGDQVWVWDTWPMTDEHGNQFSYKGWDVIFSLVADPKAGYTFDDRHVNARIGYWFRKAGDTTAEWTYGGKALGNRTPKTGAEWSGSTRIHPDGSIDLFYTDMDFTDRNKPGATIAVTKGSIKADADGVWFEGLAKTTPLLRPDGVRYQSVEQNPFFNFRDPFTFEDPAQPGKTFMVFEGNTAGKRGDYQCETSDLGQSGEDPAAVTASGANYQMANVGLAVAENDDLTQWRMLDPILSANCVNDQTERPQFMIQKDPATGKWQYYLFTISHAFTYAAGLRGPDGVYGFVGDGIRSDFKPLNDSGLALANPTNLNYSPTDVTNQNPRQYQAYSHYVMPGGLVESFIDNVDGRRGGTLAPTVKLDLDGDTTSVDLSVGSAGLLGYGYIPSNRSIGGESADSGQADTPTPGAVTTKPGLAPTAAPVGKPGKPAALKVRKKKGRTVITWDGAAGATRYEVVVKTRKGGKVLTRTTQDSRLVLRRSALERGNLKVLVTPVADGQQGPAAKRGFVIR